MGPKTRAKEAVRRWFNRHAEKRWLPILAIRHVHARAIVVGYAAPRCLVVRQDFRDGEKHMREFERENPLENVRCFDRRLREGDPCYIAYVSCNSIGQPVAVRLPRAATKGRDAKRAVATVGAKRKK